MATDTQNTAFQLAVQFVNQTNRHLFITGKAGTGKTTFLKYIKENTFKKMAVVAPTGVAAINAGGVTMHSLFHLPFGPYIPAISSGFGPHNPDVTDQHSLFKNMRMNSSKKDLLRELDLLVIDEISMVRADMLDAVDAVMRHVRRQHWMPFGGVQVVYIGDLFQLPPVAMQSEWQLLQQYYKSPFFFDAQVIQQSPPLYLELKKIYRQTDKVFISLLNNVRNNQTTTDDINLLRQYVKPGFEPPTGDPYIYLTTHNNRADAKNYSALQKLPGKEYFFEGTITGDFSDKALPADKNLCLKEGAQVMFVKNDKGEERRYFNGKIGKVLRIADDKITVGFPGEAAEIELEKETWRNIRYTYHKQQDKIEEEELGTYTQYPIRLAWAITIHKSQGLTFDKAIIDAGASFAAGQVYVALSRLTGMEGMVLYSDIRPGSMMTDERVVAFTNTALQEDALQQHLQAEQRKFLAQQLIVYFDWARLLDEWETHHEGYAHRQFPGKSDAVLWSEKLLEAIREQEKTANRFLQQLSQLITMAEQDGYQQLYPRVKAAYDFFHPLLQQVEDNLKKHFAGIRIKSKVKKYSKELERLQVTIKRKMQQLSQALTMAEGMMKGLKAEEVLTSVQQQSTTEQASPQQQAIIKTTKAPKGESHRISLELYKEGKTIEEIAALRSFAQSTIEGHLVSFITTGELTVDAFVSEEQLARINEVIDTLGETSSGAIKEKLGAAISYSQIRAVINHRKRLLAIEENT